MNAGFPKRHPSDAPDFAQHLFYSTVRISGENTATGFLFRPEDDGPIYLITNRHVVDTRSPSKVSLLQAIGDEPLHGEDVTIEVSPDRWVYHPRSTVDVAALDFDALQGEMLDHGHSPYFETLGDWGPSATDMTQHTWIEEVTFVGYPNGLYDRVHLTPIVRRGITATPFNLDWQGEPAFLIDAFVIPGSSGSPVAIVKDGLIRNKGGNYTTGTSLTFLGVLGKVIGREAEATWNDVLLNEPKYHNLGVVFNWRTITEVVQELRQGSAR